MNDHLMKKAAVAFLGLLFAVWLFVIVSHAVAQEKKGLFFHQAPASAAQQAACWKTDTTTGALVLSYCTSTVTSAGTCTCN